MPLNTYHCYLYNNVTYRQVGHTKICKLYTMYMSLQNWESTWQMSFNPDKCEVLRITNKCNKIMANYYIHSQQLQIVDNTKYLGLTISKNLSWNNHVNNITKKENSTLAFLRRNIRNCPQRAKTQAYNTFVRPPLLCGIHILRPTSIK